MITRKIRIKSISDNGFVKEKQSHYSYAFRNLYKRFEESTDSNFIKGFKIKFNLNDIEYRSIVSEVKSFKNRYLTSIKNKKDRIEDIKKEIINLWNKEVTKKNKYAIYKLKNKIVYLTNFLDNEVIFGGRANLRKISYLSNIKDKDSEQAKSFNDHLKLYKYGRILPFAVIGEANKKGNRFFDFSRLNDWKVTYKPSKGTKIELDLVPFRNFRSELTKLSELASNNEISVSVKLSTEYIFLTFDEEKLNGYSIDEKAKRKEVAEIKKQGYSKEQESALIKEVYKNYYDKQRDLKLINKVKNRCIAIDLNPTVIGFSILDLKFDNSVKLIYKGLINSSKLTKKLGLKSSHEVQIKQNNKRKYELYQEIKYLFGLAVEYKCSKFIIEDLEFKSKDKTFSTKVNRKIKNIWNRTLIINSITKHCNQLGIELIPVNPIYSSFIGNLSYEYADPTNASIEIGRRGLTKYIKDTFYPLISDKIIHTMEALTGIDVGSSATSNWAEMYNSAKKIKWRRTINEVETPHKSFSLKSYRSKVNIEIFQ